jgi:ribonuclease P protein component
VASPLSHPRAGVVVPKRGRSTVSRNCVKRRLREIVRLYLLPTAEPIDFVIRARNEAYGASFEELRLDLVAAVERLSRALQPTE